MFLVVCCSVLVVVFLLWLSSLGLLLVCGVLRLGLRILFSVCIVVVMFV